MDVMQPLLVFLTALLAFCGAYKAGDQGATLVQRLAGASAALVAIGATVYSIL